MPTMKMAALTMLALAALSCTKELGSGPTGGTDNGSITATDPGGGVTTPAATLPSLAAIPAPARVRPISETRTGLVETLSAPPSPAELAAVAGQQERLNGIAAGVPGTTVKFVDCSTAVCTSRLEAKSLGGLRDLLQAVSKDQGGIAFVAREQLNAYTGQSFVADVSFGGERTRPVPADENELLINDDVP